MDTPFLGMIALFGFNFAPRGWAFCAGQQLAISSNSALFALLGTIYGGNGQTTFALPDLRGRVPIGFGQGPGTGNYPIGERGGEPSVTLTTQTMPAHNHTATATSTSTSVLNGENAAGDAPSPHGHLLGATQSNPYVAAGGKEIAMASQAVTTTTDTTVEVANNGGNQAHDNMQPFLAMNYCIALQGIFPSRN